MENNYWNGNGTYQTEVDRLCDLMPSRGKTDNRYMK